MTPGASATDIRRAYRRLVMRFHPDHVGGSVKEFLEIKAAFEAILAHPRTTTPNARRAPAASGTIAYRPARGYRPVTAVAADRRDRGTGWAGGRWYWEGLGANAVKRAQRERAS